MAKLTEQELKREISSGKFKNIYLIYGEEKYLVRHYTKMLVNKVTGKKTNNLDYIKLSSVAEIEDIASAAEQIPIFSDYKCVLVSDYNVESLSESEFKEFEEFCSDISKSTVLIFSMPTLITENKKPSGKKGGKFKRFLSRIEENGSVAEFESKGETALEKQLISWAEKEGCILKPKNALKIIGMCGTDLTTLLGEMHKLTAYTEKGEITEEIIELLVVKNTETRIFALSDCIMKNDFNGAYNHMHRLFEQNEKGEIILSVLSSVFVDMYRMRVAKESGKSISDVENDFKYGKRSFVLKRAESNSRKYSTQTLRKVLNVILETDIKIKSSRAPDNILLETMISKMIITIREDK